jgi:hypothetical protein
VVQIRLSEFSLHRPAVGCVLGGPGAVGTARFGWIVVTSAAPESTGDALADPAQDPGDLPPARPGGSGNDATTVGHIPNPEVHAITPMQFTVGGEIEQGEISHRLGDLQPYADRPDLPELEGRLRSEQSALVSGPMATSRSLCMLGVHDMVPAVVEEP